MNLAQHEYIHCKLRLTDLIKGREEAWRTVEWEQAATQTSTPVPPTSRMAFQPTLEGPEEILEILNGVGSKPTTMFTSIQPPMPTDIPDAQ